MTAPRVAILTGRSDPARPGLPQAQAMFLATVVPPGMHAVEGGYPWTAGPPEGRVALPVAAWRNLRQWRAARAGKARCEVTARLRALGGDRLAIVTGSCGLDLLCCGWVAEACELIVALGPVTTGRPVFPGARLVTVVGRRDGLSRVVHRALPDHRVPCGHLGYWDCAQARRVVARALQDWAG